MQRFDKNPLYLVKIFLEKGKKQCSANPTADIFGGIYIGY